MTMRRYRLPADTMFLTDDIARQLHLLIEPVRRSSSRYLDSRPALRQWLAELDEFAVSAYSSTPAPPRSPTWIATSEAAKLLGVKDRQARNMAAKLRTQRVGGRLLFDRDDVLDEVDARSIARTAPSGNGRSDGVA